MLGGTKNLKDGQNDLDITIRDRAIYVAREKINKLVTALYMVTDIIDRDEPLRSKLRTVGTEIISDIHLIQHNDAGHISSYNACNNITQIISFLDIASAMSIISPMNCNILKKEFSQFSQSIKENTDKVEIPSGQINLSGFFAREIPEMPQRQSLKGGKYKSLSATRQAGIGHNSFTGLGVQKGSTLMQALSDKSFLLTDSNSSLKDSSHFLELKKERRDRILDAIKVNGGNATIKDIKSKIDALGNAALNFSEKTLQRELMSMTKEGLLEKTGEKRWSKYSLPGSQAAV